VRRGLYDFPNDSPYYKPTIEESVAELRALELADVRKLYQELLGASHTEVAVAGDFTAGEVLVALGESFRDWDSPAACVAIDPPYHPVAEAQRRIVTPDKPMAIVGYATLFEMRDDDPDYPAMLLAQQILGGDSEARLGARLRHAEGLSYHAASAMQVEPRIACANLFGYAFCTPVQADTCLTGLREEVSRLIREGVTDEELAKAREAWRRDFELNLGDDAEFTSELVSLEENGRSLGYYKQVLVRMESLTAADVNRVLRDRLGAAEFLSVQAGDF
jgi:zinc protease